MTYYIDTSDERNLVVQDLLEKDGKNTCILNININKFRENDCLIFSPAKKFSEEEIKNLPNNVTLYGGNSCKNFIEILKEKNINFINIMEDEIFTVKNANLTCEGVLALMIEKSKKSLFENKILILGGGRIAKGLAVLFGKLGLCYAIVSFNPIKFPDYFIYSKKCYFKYSFVEDLEDYDIIINTIPAEIIDKDVALKIAQDTIYIETASVNSINIEYTKHFEFVPAPALPKKYTCHSAGKFLYEMIIGGNNYV